MNNLCSNYSGRSLILIGYKRQLLIEFFSNIGGFSCLLGWQLCQPFVYFREIIQVLFV